jgi:hypothetical protein
VGPKYGNSPVPKKIVIRAINKSIGPIRIGYVCNKHRDFTCDKRRWKAIRIAIEAVKVET